MQRVPGLMEIVVLGSYQEVGCGPILPMASSIPSGQHKRVHQLVLLGGTPIHLAFKPLSTTLP